MNKFAELLLWCRNELLALKTGRIKSSQQVETTTKTGTLAFDFELRNVWAQSTKEAIIVVRSKTGAPILAQLTLNITDNEDRLLSGVGTRGPEGVTDDGGLIFPMSVYGNADDTQKLFDGEPASVSYTFTITATGEFDVDILYEDL